MDEIDQGFFKLTERSEVNLKQTEVNFIQNWPRFFQIDRTQWGQFEINQGQFDIIWSPEAVN